MSENSGSIEFEVDELALESEFESEPWSEVDEEESDLDIDCCGSTSASAIDKVANSESISRIQGSGRLRTSARGAGSANAISLESFNASW